jgi:MFS transporter, Spinster family, sphingosine-1-phosphate transporter
LLGGGWSIGIMASLQYLLPDRFRATGTAMFTMVTTLLGFVIGPWATGALSEWMGDGTDSLRIALSIVIPTGIIGAGFAIRSTGFGRCRLGIVFGAYEQARASELIPEWK